MRIKILAVGFVCFVRGAGAGSSLPVLWHPHPVPDTRGAWAWLCLPGSFTAALVCLGPAGLCLPDQDYSPESFLPVMWQGFCESSAHVWALQPCHPEPAGFVLMESGRAGTRRTEPLLPAPTAPLLPHPRKGSKWLFFGKCWDFSAHFAKNPACPNMPLILGKTQHFAGCDSHFSSLALAAIPL